MDDPLRHRGLRARPRRLGGSPTRFRLRPNARKTCASAATPTSGSSSWPRTPPTPPGTADGSGHAGRAGRPRDWGGSRRPGRVGRRGGRQGREGRGRRGERAGRGRRAPPGRSVAELQVANTGAPLTAAVWRRSRPARVGQAGRRARSAASASGSRRCSPSPTRLGSSTTGRWRSPRRTAAAVADSCPAAELARRGRRRPAAGLAVGRTPP